MGREGEEGREEGEVGKDGVKNVRGLNRLGEGKDLVVLVGVWGVWAMEATVIGSTVARLQVHIMLMVPKHYLQINLTSVFVDMPVQYMPLPIHWAGVRPYLRLLQGQRPSPHKCNSTKTQVCL